MVDHNSTMALNMDHHREYFDREKVVMDHRAMQMQRIDVWINQ